MRTELDGDNRVHYSLPIGSDLVNKDYLELNSLIGEKIKLEFTGNIHCIDTGKKIKKTFNNGYSYESFMKKASCDTCIVKPELCHYAQGTCREPQWGETHCLKPHYVYLANSSGVKVGITRLANTPFRWIDQGAIQAMPIIKVKDRLTSGKLEVLLKDEFMDKTSWQKMLKGVDPVDNFQSLKEMAIKKVKKEMEKLNAEVVEHELIEINYPITEKLEKVKSVNFDKLDVVEDTLIGIKGQYLIFKSCVMNIRRHQGYEIKVFV
jgi:hypothetical protein